MKALQVHDLSFFKELYVYIAGIVYFESGDVPKGITCAGVVGTKYKAREVMVTVRDFDEQRCSAELAEYGADGVAVEDLTLEDIFVELLPREDEVVV